MIQSAVKPRNCFKSKFNDKYLKIQSIVDIFVTSLIKLVSFEFDINNIYSNSPVINPCGNHSYSNLLEKGIIWIILFLTASSNPFVELESRRQKKYLILLIK